MCQPMGWNALTTLETSLKAFSFMAGTALQCERLNHHPEWSNVYGKVHVRLVTHDRSGVTNLDATLAD